MEPKEYLNQRMQQEGQKYGFTSIGAEFEEFRNLIVRWRRTNRWIRLRVSDYIMDAPESVIDSLCEVIFKQISGRRTKYPENLMAWLTDPSFCLRNRQTFLNRNPMMTGSSEGIYKDLDDSYKRLVDAGLVKYDPDVMICWNTTASVKEPSQYSVLMKAVSITDLLDDPEVPDFAIDWLIYHDLCIVQSGYDPYCAKRTVPAKVARRFPRMMDAKEFVATFLADKVIEEGEHGESDDDDVYYD